MSGVEASYAGWRARASASIRSTTSSTLELGRVDLDRVLRRGHPLGVLLVARRGSVSSAASPTSGTLGAPPRGADLGVGDEVDLQLGVRRDDGADVPALHDRVGPLAEARAGARASPRAPAGGGRRRAPSCRSAPSGSTSSRRRRRSRRARPGRARPDARARGRRACRRRRGRGLPSSRARSAPGTSRPCRGSGSRSAPRASARRCSCPRLRVRRWR